MSIFSNLFERTPKYDVSAYGPIYSAVVSRLSRTGVKVGGTAGYPRVEVHSIIEGERMDKDGQLRQVTLVVESIGNASLAATVRLNEDNLKLLTEYGIELEGWSCLGVVPGQLQDLTETADSAKIIYRQLQSFTIYLSKDKPEEAEEYHTDTGNPGQPVNPVTPINPGGPIVIH